MPALGRVPPLRRGRQSLTGPYLTASQAMTRAMLYGRTGPRDFRRIIIVAALGRNNGIGSGARLQWSALRRQGFDAELLDAAPAMRNPFFQVPHRPGTAYVFHADGRNTASLIRSVLPHAADAWRVGYWAWELPDPPSDWRGCDSTLGEIWTPSAFSRDSLARLLVRPVEVVPHIVAPRAPHRRRADAPFTVLTMADSRSSLSRKNPEGALRAFRDAFGTSPAARLIIKLGGRPGEISALEASLGEFLGTGNVEIVREHLDEAAMAGLYDRADVLLSLHRAEGFGLPIAEAMAHGLPVVATNWSGNRDIMSDEDSCPVPYTLVPVRDASGIYAGSQWAEPDLAAAAEALRRLQEDTLYYTRIAAAAHRRARLVEPRFPMEPLSAPHRSARAEPFRAGAVAA